MRRPNELSPLAVPLSLALVGLTAGALRRTFTDELPAVPRSSE